MLLPDPLQKSGEGHAVVGVVHDDGFFLVDISFHSPGNAGGEKARPHVAAGDPQDAAHPHGGQGVGDIEVTAHGQGERLALSLVGGGKGLSPLDGRDGLGA